jgi:hypothetical protein
MGFFQVIPTLWLVDLEFFCYWDSSFRDFRLCVAITKLVYLKLSYLHLCCFPWARTAWDLFGIY